MMFFMILLPLTCPLDSLVFHEVFGGLGCLDYHEVSYMPRIKLTNENVVRAIKPGPKRVDYYDVDERGLALRVYPNGKKTWNTVYRYNGRMRRHTFGTWPATSPAVARKRARGALADVEKGIDPAAKKREERQAESFAELAHEYLERHAKPKKKSWQEDERIINSELVPAWGHIKAKNLKRADVRALLDKIVERGSPIAANRTLEIIRKMYNWGIENDLVEANPCHRIPKPAKERQRDRVLTEDEIQHAWTAMCEEALLTRSFFQLRLVTAQRGIEIRSMRWKNIDGDWWTIPAEFSKNGLSHRVPLSPMAAKIISDIEADTGRSPDEWVFPSPVKPGEHIGELFTAFDRIRNRSEIENFKAHDLRRTAASMMTSVGIPRLVVSKILNHVETGVTAVYDRHSYDQEKRDALDQWSRKLKTMVTHLKAVEETQSRAQA